MLDELYNSHKFNIDIFSYRSSINLGTGYEAFTKQLQLVESIMEEDMLADRTAGAVVEPDISVIGMKSDNNQNEIGIQKEQMDR